jgi:Ca2+-binding RTX toxin-like protein
MKAKLVPATLAALTVIMLGSTPASAATTCTFNPSTRVLTLTYDAPAQDIITRQQTGDTTQIEVITPGPGGGTEIPCTGGTPTVSNTDRIVVTESSSLFTGVTLWDPASFRPGFTNEPGSSDEIEWSLNSIEGLDILGSEGPDVWRFGNDGVNFNAAEGSTDRDVSFTGIQSTEQVTGNSRDLVDGRGGAGTGGAFPFPMGVQSGDGNDVVNGGSADDSVRPEGFSSMNTNDVVTGGAGRDTIDYFFAPSGVRVNLSAGTAVGPATGNDTLGSIENVLGSDVGNDFLIGNPSPNRLEGEGGNDRIRPVGGGGPLLDTPDGGDGIDTVDYSNEPRRVRVDLTSGPPSCSQGATGASIGTDCLIAIERAIGGMRADLLIGDGGNNQLTGGPGDDEARGGGGADVLRGMADSDELFGEAGPDQLDGGRHADLCVGGADPDTFTRCEEEVQ